MKPQKKIKFWKDFLLERAPLRRHRLRLRKIRQELTSIRDSLVTFLKLQILILRFFLKNNIRNRLIKFLSKKNNNLIIVMCGCDDNYVEFTATMIKSLAVNHITAEKLLIFLLDVGMSKISMDKLLKSISSNRVEIKVIPVNLKEIELLKKEGSIEPTRSCCRIIMPYILPDKIEKVIYLDSDIVILDDVSKLWHMDFRENIILARQDLLLKCRDGIANYKELGIDPETKYFNNGVMLIDLKKWREEKISEKVIKYGTRPSEHTLASGKWEQFGQYGLNVVLAGKWRELDERWNYWSTSEKTIPAIVHYIGSSGKPWLNGCNEFFRYIFYYYLDKTEWKGWRRPNG